MLSVLKIILWDDLWTGYLMSRWLRLRINKKLEAVRYSVWRSDKGFLLLCEPSIFFTKYSNMNSLELISSLSAVSPEEIDLWDDL